MDARLHPMFITTIMRKISILALLLLLCSFAVGQSASPNLNPDQADQPDKTPPEISFTLDFPAASPPFYNIAIDADGRAEYKSTPLPKNQGDPYEVKFLASEPTRTRVFDLAKKLDFFRGNFDYTKSKVAFSGTKTLMFKNGQEERQTSYNWSQNPDIQELTTLFQGIAETMNLGRELDEKYRFDKLGVDAVLKLLDQEAHDNRLAELQVLQPTLTRIAKDPGMMNISRRLAESLLARIPKPAATTASAGGQK
jgi:hypothetical protein